MKFSGKAAEIEKFKWVFMFMRFCCSYLGEVGPKESNSILGLVKDKGLDSALSATLSRRRLLTANSLARRLISTISASQTLARKLRYVPHMQI